MRAFADMFVHQANLDGQNIGSICLVQSTDSERARIFNEQHCRYHVAIRGLQDGERIDTVEEVTAISKALTASNDWPEILKTARSPELKFLFSNTTEAGPALKEGDKPEDSPPSSFPARLLVLLKERYDAGQGGLAIIPCELLELNADKLLNLVIEQAVLWEWNGMFLDWIQNDCVWLNSLVDRIVTDRPDDYAPFPEDRLLAVGEPYALWAVEQKQTPSPLPRHNAILLTPDVMPYFLRKVRILNGAHQALISKALPKGYQTVLQAVSDPEIMQWLEALLFEEIVPTLEGRVEEPELFARQTLERFSNPYLNHKLSEIAKNHLQKVQIRLGRTRDEYIEKFGKTPIRLETAFAFRP